MESTTNELQIRLSGGYYFGQIERLIRDLKPLADLDEPRRLLLDLSGLAFMSPSAPALLIAVVRRLEEEGLILDQSSVTLPLSTPVRNYLRRMDFERILAAEQHPEPFARREPVGFRPCQRFRDAEDLSQVASTLTAAVSERVQTDPPARGSLQITLAELTENVVQHADTALGGFAAAQALKKTP